MALGLGLALLDGPLGVLAVHAGYTGAEALAALGVILAIALCIFATGLATDEHSGGAVSAILGLPVVLFAYWQVIGYGYDVNPAVVYAFLPFGIIGILVALRPAPKAQSMVSAANQSG